MGAGQTHTRYGAGGCCAAGWKSPCWDAGEITRRQGAVEELTQSTVVRSELEEALKDVSDLERIMARVVTGTVNCRDMLGLARGLRALPDVKAQLSQLEAPMLKRLCADLDPITGLRRPHREGHRRERAPDPPEGGLLKKGANAEADRLRDVMTAGPIP